MPRLIGCFGKDGAKTEPFSLGAEVEQGSMNRGVLGGRQAGQGALRELLALKGAPQGPRETKDTAQEKGLC